MLKYPRDQVNATLDELRTTQRYEFYRALQHPLYPILRKIERMPERCITCEAVRPHRIVYASNHKSHTDYLVEPLVLDDNGIRPPLIAAGINLFGGPLGLIHRHVTGAIPIRRNTKDPAYLVTLKAYVAGDPQEARPVLLPRRRPQLQRRAEGGEDRPVQRGARRRPADLVIIPVAIAYDLVLEDHILAHQQRQEAAAAVRPRGRRDGALRRRLPVARVRHVRRADPGRRSSTSHSRSDVLELARLVRARIGALYKVLPTALFAAAMRPSITRRDLESRIDQLIEELAARHANLGVTSGRQAVEEARRAARDARHRRRRARRASASASAPCCATTRGRSSTCS